MFASVFVQSGRNCEMNMAEIDPLIYGLFSRFYRCRTAGKAKMQELNRSIR
jgi:hypothetical protein